MSLRKTLSVIVAFLVTVLVVGARGAEESPGGGSRPVKTKAAPARVDGRPASATCTLAEFAPLLEAKGLRARNLTKRVDPVYQAAFQRVVRERGAVDVAGFQFGESVIVPVVQFDDQEAQARVVQSGQPVVAYRNLVLVADVHPTAYWSSVVETFKEIGATEHGSTDRTLLDNAAKAAMVLSQLQTLRGLIELHSVANNNSFPDFEKLEWAALLEGEYLLSVPLNVLCDDAVASRLVIIKQAGADGSGVAKESAAWVWNAIDHKIYPAGTTESGLRAMMDAAPPMDHEHFIVPPEAVIMGRIGELRIAIANFYADAAVAGDARYPSLREIEEGKTSLTEIPENPFNGKRTIQRATWNSRVPPVGESAGWNYDPTVGRLWANSRVVAEHEL